MVPKDDGKDVMISAFLSRELRFGATFADEDLEMANDRVEGKHCMDREAAVKINGASLKINLTKSPHVVEFECGN